MADAFNLRRFVLAQDPDYDSILGELRAGRKRGHWIWYVFPQLAGLGRSTTAVHYGLADAAEAADYLRDPVLGGRLVEAAAAVRGRLTGPRRTGLVSLMGSVVDALKLVSSMTLFAHVAKALMATEPAPRFEAMADHAHAILTAAATAGYDRCAFTEEHLRRSGSSPGLG